MIKSYTYGAQGIMDFMGIAKSDSTIRVLWLQDAGEKRSTEKIILNSSHIQVYYILSAG